jgi:PAS domain S-box-containing protein
MASDLSRQSTDPPSGASPTHPRQTPDGRSVISFEPLPIAATQGFMSGGGEMGALMRAKAWADTPLGPPELWPQSLRTVIRILLTSRYQMWMGWGDDLSFFYNDAYRPTLGVKHPWALGAPAREVWREIWSDIGPRIEHVLRTGEATWDEALLLLLERSGYPEETYHTFSYSPLSDDSGAIVGMLCVVTEETERIIGERRLSSLRELASEIAGKYTRAEVLAAIGRGLGGNLKDLPFSLTYLYDEDGMARLAGVTGVPSAHVIAPVAIDPADPGAVWPAAEIRDRRVAFLTGGLDRRFADIPSGGWEKPPDEAVIAPIPRQGQEEPAGFLVAGVNPYRRHDETWLGFINLVAGQISSGLANAQAYEEERRRAEALAEINRAKTTFFSNVSHEFRTPLTLMLSPLEDVLAATDDGVAAEHRALVRVAHRNGVRLLKLVNTLLDFSRIEAGRAQAGFAPVDLVDFTAGLASNFHSAMERAGLRLVVDHSPLPAPVHVDHDMWEKVILNLLSNAFKFTFDGEIGVAARVSADGTHAEVTVRDTGIGISADELPHLFERFRRVENARGRSIEGSGIGLALVQELVRLHGGTINVESRVGQGSAFTISLPFGTDHLPADQIGRARSLVSTNVRADAYVDEALSWLTHDLAEAEDRAPVATMDGVGDVGSTEHAVGRLILLADDNADMRTYLRRLLLTAGYRVVAVTDGELALAAVKQLRPHLVLSDVMMPKLDGFGLLAELRRDPALRDTPVLLLSARAGEEAKIEGLTAGADDYLTKPFSARELLARVRTNLDLAELRREAVRVENELRREAQIARERAESILSSINDGFLALDGDWRFTFVNTAAERTLERDAKEMLGRAFWEVYPDTVGTELDARFRRAMATRESTNFENLYPPSGRWTDIKAYPSRDGGLSIYFQDITDRKRAEDALRRLNETLEAQVAERTAELRAKEARLRTIVETSFTFQGLMTVDGIVLDANATSLASIGVPEQAVVGKPFWEAPWFAATPGMPEQMRDAIPRVAGGETLRQEIYVNLPVGGWRWFDFQLLPVRDAAGEVVAIVPEAVEITARRKAEEVIRQAQKMEGIGQITGGVAHDFNNLLTIIVGNLETLRRQLRAPTPDLARLDRSADSAMRGAERAVALTQRLLAFSRQQPLDPKPVDVSRLVTGMLDLLRSTLGEQVAIETILAGGLDRVFIDANQLEIAILNLAVNARDAMPGGGRLTIETSGLRLDEVDAVAHADVAPGDYIVLTVRDTGTGMTSETLSKAFEPFFTTKDIGHGTGLGLSQVYGFVRQSGGHVSILSDLGRGTKVSLFLPRYHSVEITVADVPGVPIARGRHGETILVVEDEDEVRAHTTGILRELGYTVVEAPNGAAALGVLERHKDISLLFTDVGLPGGMNGRQLAEEARRRRPRLLVLFTTGYARDSIIHDGRLDPGVVLIAKPFGFAALAEKLREMLEADVVTEE